MSVLRDCQWCGREWLSPRGNPFCSLRCSSRCKAALQTATHHVSTCVSCGVVLAKRKNTRCWPCFLNRSGSSYRRVGNNVLEHVLIAERALGHPLPARAEVHHFNGNKRNNANRNLVICQDRRYHALLHVRQRIRARGGNPNTEAWCSECKTLKPRDEFYILKAGPRAGSPMTRCCRCNATVRARYRKPPALREVFDAVGLLAVTGENL